jgi:hypothetical protein
MLIPVDFSKSSENVMYYVADWCRDFGYQHIILLRAIQNSVFDGMLFSKEQADYHHQYLEEEKERLCQLSNRLKERAGSGVRISIAVTELQLLRSVINIVEEANVELVVISSDNERLIEITKTSPVRVLIVPSGYLYAPVRTILVPFDFKSVVSLDKIGRYMPRAAGSGEREIMVLNVDPLNKHLADERFIENENSLHNYLREIKHEIYFSSRTDVLEAILTFVQEHAIDLVVALPGKHSFLYNLTHKSISTALYLKPPKPVLILK